MAGLKALQHTRYVLINRLATPVGAFAVLIVIGRHSDALLGEYALVMTFYYIMQMMPLLGLTPYLAREVARRPAMAGKYFSSIGLISIGGCVVVNLLAYLFLGVVDYAPQVRHAIAVTGVLIFPGILLFIAEVIFMSLHRARPAAYIAVAENLSRVLVSVLALRAGGGLVELVWIFFATRLCAFIAYVSCMKATGVVERFDPPDREVLGEILRILPAFLGGAVLFVVFSRMDFLVLSIYEKVESIGYYAVGYRPFEISIILLTALIMAIFPWISRRFVAARAHYRVAVKGLMLIFAAGLALAALAGILLADTYVYLVFRNQHPHPVLLTQLFMAALIIAGLDYVASSFLHASDGQAADTRAMAVGGAINLALLYWLIPLYGIYGALFAKLGATTVQCAQKLHYMDRMIGPLWRPGELRRLVLAIVALEVAALAVVDAPFPVRMAAIFVAAILLPVLMLALNLFQPLRLLRYYWRHRGAPDVAGIGDLLDVVVADLRRRSRLDRRMPAGQRAPRARMDRASGGILVARIARHLWLRGRTAAARRLALAGQRVFGVWSSPECRIGPGWVAAADARLRINANVGSNLMCLGDALIGPAPGCRSGMTLGDSVTLRGGISLHEEAPAGTESVRAGPQDTTTDSPSRQNHP